jgi:excisionase family DNA binding protein
VSEALGIDRTTAYRMAAAGEFPSYRVGRQIRVRTKDLEAYLAGHRAPSAEENALIARGRVLALPRATLSPDDEERGHQLADELGLK